MTSEIVLLLIDLAGFALAWRQHRAEPTPVITGVAYGFTMFLMLDFTGMVFVGSLSDDIQLFLDLGQNSSSAVMRLVALTTIISVELNNRKSLSCK